jgi:hypothetical protein
VPDETRFSKLESPTELPESLKLAIEKLNRFEHLEIGDLKAPPAAVSHTVDRLLCPHCGQANESERTHCWACFWALKPELQPANRPAPDQPIELVFNGVSYSSADPNLPDSIRVLMDRIRREGYSQKLMEDWQRSLAATPAPLGPPLFGDGRVQVFKGQRISIIRLDGKVYKSDDPGLAPEFKEIFDYVEREGMTPMLLQHLRLYGTKVKFRPLTTPTPSDGDKTFWNAAQKAIGR